MERLRERERDRNKGGDKSNGGAKDKERHDDKNKTRKGKDKEKETKHAKDKALNTKKEIELDSNRLKHGDGDSNKEPMELEAPKLDFDSMTPEELERTIRELELREQVLQNLMENIKQSDEGKKTKRIEKAGKQLANKEAELREKALLALMKMRAAKPIPPTRPVSSFKFTLPAPHASSSKLSSVIAVPVKPNPPPAPPTLQPTKEELELRQKALQMLLLQRTKVAKTNVKTDQPTKSDQPTQSNQPTKSEQLTKTDELLEPKEVEASANGTQAANGIGISENDGASKDKGELEVRVE